MHDMLRLTTWMFIYKSTLLQINITTQPVFALFRTKATLFTFETLKWKYTFATDVLIAIRDEAPLVCRAPDVSEHSHFGTCHIKSMYSVAMPNHTLPNVHMQSYLHSRNTCKDQSEQ